MKGSIDILHVYLWQIAKKVLQIAPMHLESATFRSVTLGLGPNLTPDPLSMARNAARSQASKSLGLLCSTSKPLG